MCRPPNASTAAATAAVLAAGSATSVWTKRPPSSSATALPRATSMSAITTWAPRPARCRATPSPMPLLAPGDQGDLAVHVRCHGLDRRGRRSLSRGAGRAAVGRGRCSGAGWAGSWPRRAAAARAGPRRRWRAGSTTTTASNSRPLAAGAGTMVMGRVMASRSSTPTSVWRRASRLSVGHQLLRGDDGHQRVLGRAACGPRPARRRPARRRPRCATTGSVRPARIDDGRADARGGRRAGAARRSRARGPGPGSRGSARRDAAGRRRAGGARTSSQSA